MRKLMTLAIAVSVALATMAAPAAAQEASASLVSVVHGVPGATVDVYVNGDLFLEDFEPETIAGPVVLPAGTYDIAIYAADADPDTADPVIDAPGVEVPAGVDAAVVAHLGADGNPTASVFVNDTSEIADGEARLTLRHTAEAPEVGVAADGNLLTSGGFINGEEVVVDVPTGTYQATVTAPDDADNVLAELGGLTLEEAANTIVYAIGTYTGDPSGTFSLVVDSIMGLGPEGAFTDDNDSVHEANIGMIARIDVTRGCNPPDNTEYCPTQDVTRGEMAAFLVRALDLEQSSTDYFEDDDDSVFEGDINALREAGITQGRDDGTYGPNDPVNRGQMAAFLNRAFVQGAETAGDDTFTDDDDSIFESDIEAIAAAGITVGCNPPDNTEYCPERNVTRAEMATFLARALGIGS